MAEKTIVPTASGSSVESRMKRKVIREAIIPAGEPWSAELNRGQVLRIIDLEGQQGLDFLCYNKGNPEERYSAPHSIKKAATLNLTRGNVLYSDAARAMVTIIEDTCGHNDTIAGCCSEQTNWLFYGKNESHGSCRSNFLKAMKPYGLGWRDLVPNVNFFSKVVADDQGGLHFDSGAAKAGSYIDLRMEMDTLVILNTCQHPLDPNLEYAPKPVKLEVFPAEPLRPDDACLRSRPENLRAYQNTVTYNTLRF